VSLRPASLAVWAIGAGVGGAGAFGRAIVGLGELGLGAAFLATGLALAFLGAALTALRSLVLLPAFFAWPSSAALSFSRHSS